MIGSLHEPWRIIVLTVIGLIYIGSFWQIFKKAGYVPAVSLVMLVPYVNILAFLWLAFYEWPVQKRLRELESEDLQDY